MRLAYPDRAGSLGRVNCRKLDDMPLPEHVSVAIDEALRDIEDIEARAGVIAGSLRDMQTRLIELVTSRSFSALAPPSAGERGIYYVLSEGARLPYGLYLNVAPAGNRAPPHCHGVWCVAAGFKGEEINRFYQRVNDSSDQAQLSEIALTLVRPGTGMCMLPDDIHAVEVAAAAPVAHVHLYGLRLSEFPQLSLYDLEHGTRRSAPAPDARPLP